MVRDNPTFELMTLLLIRIVFETDLQLYYVIVFMFGIIYIYIYSNIIQVFVAAYIHTLIHIAHSEKTHMTTNKFKTNCLSQE